MTLKNVVKSSNLSDYALTKPLSALLEKVLQMDQYIQAGGAQKPPFIRLYRHDLTILDNLVRRQSEGAFNIGTVMFKGRKVIAGDDPEPVFQLEASP